MWSQSIGHFELILRESSVHVVMKTSFSSTVFALDEIQPFFDSPEITNEIMK